MTTVRRKQIKKESSQLELTTFSGNSITESSEESPAKPTGRAIGAVVLSTPPYLLDYREARLSQMDLILNELRVEIHRLPSPSRYIARLILDVFLEIQDALAQEGK
jgi:hypothetical protein